ncbi:PHP domain-containing protein [Thiovibrio sp. JS02]
MSRHIDLHTHSTCSDGILTPTALVDLAARRRLLAISLTDHDTVAGVAEAVRRGREKGVEVLPGIEVSSRLENTSLHILGYGIRPEDQNFLAFVEKLQAAREQRNQGIIARFAQLGIPIAQKELTSLAGDQIGRPHFARLLVKKGICKSAADAFACYLKRGGPAFVEHERPPADEVIREIDRAGGLAMLAHPASLDSSLEKIPSLVAQLKGYGLSGIEAYYPTHSNKVCRVLLALASEQELLPCGGTDFHGDSHSGAPLGGSAKTIRVPQQVWREIMERLNAR